MFLLLGLGNVRARSDHAGTGETPVMLSLQRSHSLNRRGRDAGFISRSQVHGEGGCLANPYLLLYRIYRSHVVECIVWYQMGWDKFRHLPSFPQAIVYTTHYDLNWLVER